MRVTDRPSSMGLASGNPEERREEFRQLCRDLLADGFHDVALFDHAVLVRRQLARWHRRRAEVVAHHRRARRLYRRRVRQDPVGLEPERPDQADQADEETSKNAAHQLDSAAEHHSEEGRAQDPSGVRLRCSRPAGEPGDAFANPIRKTPAGRPSKAPCLPAKVSSIISPANAPIAPATMALKRRSSCFDESADRPKLVLRQIADRPERPAPQTQDIRVDDVDRLP